MSNREILRRFMAWAAFAAVFYLVWRAGLLKEEMWPSILWLIPALAASLFIYWVFGQAWGEENNGHDGSSTQEEE